MAAKKRLVSILLKGAMTNGYITELWTTARIAEVIRLNFGITYHRDHSHQKPEKRALQLDEKAVEEWKLKEWPRIKKTLRGWVPI